MGFEVRVGNSSSSSSTSTSQLISLSSSSISDSPFPSTLTSAKWGGEFRTDEEVEEAVEAEDSKEEPDDPELESDTEQESTVVERILVVDDEVVVLVEGVIEAESSRKMKKVLSQHWPIFLVRTPVFALILILKSSNTVTGSSRRIRKLPPSL